MSVKERWVYARPIRENTREHYHFNTYYNTICSILLNNMMPNSEQSNLCHKAPVVHPLVFCLGISMLSIIE